MASASKTDKSFWFDFPFVIHAIYYKSTTFKCFVMFILEASEICSLLLCSPQPSLKNLQEISTVTELVVSLSTFTGYWYFLGIGPPTSRGLFFLCKSCKVVYSKNQNIRNVVEPQGSALAKGKLEQVKQSKPEAAAKSAVGVPKVLHGRKLTSGFPEARENMQTMLITPWFWWVRARDT